MKDPYPKLKRVINNEIEYNFMTGEIVLGGGGNEKEDFEVLQYFSNGLKRVLYIPLAFPVDNYDGCLKWFKSYFKRFDLDDKVTMITNLDSKIDLNNFDGIYIGGGNTFKLLKKIKDSNFDKKLINFYKNGGRIGGGSAGSIIFGNNINIALICEDMDQNLVDLKNTTGMNTCNNWDVQAHYFDKQLDKHLNYIKKNKRNVIGIPNESAVVVSGGKFKVIGQKEITLISSSSILKIEIGKEFEL